MYNIIYTKLPLYRGEILEITQRFDSIRPTMFFSSYIHVFPKMWPTFTYRTYLAHLFFLRSPIATVTGNCTIGAHDRTCKCMHVPHTAPCQIHVHIPSHRVPRQGSIVTPCTYPGGRQMS